MRFNKLSGTLYLSSLKFATLPTSFLLVDVTSCSSHPDSQLLQSGTIVGKLVIKFFKYHTESCEQGAVNVLYPILCPYIDNNGKCFDKCSERDPNKSALDEVVQKIWDLSVNSLKERGFLKEYHFNNG